MTHEIEPVDPSAYDPPPGYESWLEYAVASFDVRATLGPAYSDEEREMQRQLSIALWEDFNELRKRAGLPTVSPKGLRCAAAHEDGRSLLDLLALPEADELDVDMPHVAIRARDPDF